MGAGFVAMPGCGRIEPMPGRAVDPPGRRPGVGAGRFIPPAEGSEGRVVEPRLGRDRLPGPCAPGRLRPPGIWGRACGIWGRVAGRVWAVGIWGRACGIWGRDIGRDWAVGICGRDICGREACGRDIGADGRDIPPAGRAMPPAGRAMPPAGRPPPPRWPPPPPGRASARGGSIPRDTANKASTTAAGRRITDLTRWKDRGRVVTSRRPVGAACGRSSSRNRVPRRRR